jgi:hypothetical protein
LQGFNTSLETLAALGAELGLRFEGLSGDSRLSSLLHDVVQKIEPGILDGLDQNQERAALSDQPFAIGLDVVEFYSLAGDLKPQFLIAPDDPA